VQAVVETQRASGLAKFSSTENPEGVRLQRGGAVPSSLNRRQALATEGLFATSRRIPQGLKAASYGSFNGTPPLAAEAVTLQRHSYPSVHYR
jgi:hypothetical protein